MENLSKEGRQQIIKQAITYFEDGCGVDVYGSDIHHEIYNTDYFIIGYKKAEDWLKEHYGVFNALEKIKDYEEENFGEVITSLTYPESVVNALVYILGEEILNEIEILQDKWNEKITEEECQKIIEELKSML